MQRVLVNAVSLCALAGFAAACARDAKSGAAGPDQNQADLLPDDHLHPVVVSGRLLVSSTAFGRPEYALTQGNRLWISDQAGDPYIHLIDISGRRIVASFGHTGVGPGDFDQGISGLSRRPGDATAAWALSLGLRRLTRVPAISADTVVTIPLTAPRFADHAEWLTRGRLLLIGETDTSRFVLADSNGKPLRVVSGDLVGGDSISLATRVDRSSGLSLCVAPDGARFAVFYIHAGRMDLYDSNAALIRHGDVPFAINGSFRRDSAGRWHAHDIRRYYEACSSSSTRIYALFSGKRLGPRYTGADVEAQFVHIFDWTGRFLGALHLDQPLAGMTTSGDSVMYGIGADGSRIYSYRLPSFNSAPAVSVTPTKSSGLLFDAGASLW